MFIYKNWELFCSRIRELEIQTYTAVEALSISSKDNQYIIIKHDVVPIRIINNGEKNLFKNSSKIAVEIFKLHPKKKFLSLL